MTPRFLSVAAALIGVGARRSKVVVNEHVQVEEANATTKSACDKWLMIEYDDGNKTAGSFRYTENQWSWAKLFEKTTKDGCKETYFADCWKGQLGVEKTCDHDPSVKIRSTRCLTGLCLEGIGGHKSKIGKGQTAKVFDKQVGGDDNPLPFTELTEGSIKVWVADPKKGIELQQPPGRGSWNAETGCYCCQRKWFPLNPFDRDTSRAAWSVGPDGKNPECMLAWQMIGNGEKNWKGVLKLIPEIVLSVADTATLTIGRHIACAATCSYRNPKYEANRYSFAKIQTSQDKY